MSDTTDGKICYAEKLKSAMAFLGTNWVLHKKYKHNPKHSPAGYALEKAKV